MSEPREFVLGRPIGGVNTRTYPTELPDEDFVMIKNMDPFANIGAFVTRKGTETWNTTIPVSNKPVRGAFRFYYGSSSRDLLMIAGTTIWKTSGGAGDFTSIATGVTEDRDWFFASYLDRCYIVNGIDAMKRWDGTNMTSAGYPAPGSAPTVATGAAGVLTGAYQYKVTAVYDSNSAHESGASSASSTVNPSSQKVELTNIPTPTNATSRNIYRTQAGGSTFYFLASIADNVTTTYSDNTADASLSSSTAAADNGSPPAAQFVLFWRGRMVALRTVAAPARVFFSSITTSEKSPGGGQTVHGADPEIFPASHYIDVGDDNSPITGAAILQDQLVIFKEDQIWNISGDDALDFRVWRSQSNVGCIAPKTIVNMRGTLFFLGRNEGIPAVYSYDGASSDEISLPIEPTLISNVAFLGDVSNQPIQPCATRYRGSYLLSYRKTGDTPYEVAILDTRPPRPRWVFWNNIEASVFIPLNGRGDAGEMYYGSRSEARVLRLDSKLTEYDATTPTATAGYIETGWLDLRAPYHIKEIHWIDIYGKEGDQPGACEPDPGDTTITVERRYDFDTTGTSVGCASVNVSTATKHMSRKLWKHRIHCEGSEGTVPEICYRIKLLITTSGPIEIHRIVVNFTPHTPEDTHGQN